MDERIIGFFKDHAEELTGDLSALVSVLSVKGEAAAGAPYGKGPRAVLDAACGMAESHGLAASVLGDRVCVTELGEGDAALGIMAHLDVVPPAGEWTKTAPTKLLLEDGVFYGRGVADDKGPAVAALYALLAVRELGIPLRRKVRLILGSDEECGSSDIEWYQQHYRMPPRVFTPDASFPLVNGEKGMLRMTVSASGAGALCELAGGSVANAVPADCRAVVSGVTVSDVERAFAGLPFTAHETDGGVEILCKGKAAHASTPQDGVNAISAMLQGLSALLTDASPLTEAVRALHAAFPFGDTQGRAFNAFCEDEETGKLTVNLGVIMLEDGKLTALIDCRVPASGNSRAIADKLRRSVGSAANVAVNGIVPPHNTPADSDLVRGLLKIYEDYTGKPGRAFTIGGGTYVHNVEGGVAFGCEFPGTEYHMHEPDERMPLDELLLAGAMFAQAIVDFCA